jgi:mRNA-degrading endonuclease toxin of MazEF toxin-antitoxin module
MTRGEIWWAELAGDAGFRPVVIVSRAEGLENLFRLGQALRYSLDLE